MAEIKPQSIQGLASRLVLRAVPRPGPRGPQGGWVYDLARVILTLPTVLVFRTRAIGTENVPADGPVLLAPNHFSQMDHFFCAVYLRRKVRFMAKSQLFGPPVVTFIFHHGGAFPVRRGHADEEAFKTSYAILERGHPLLIYAEGGRSRIAQPRRAAPRHRPDRARVRGPGGADRDPRLGRGPRAGGGCASPRSPSSSASRSASRPRPRPSREQQLEAAEEIFDRVRTMYTALEEKGRRRRHPRRCARVCPRRPRARPPPRAEAQE